MLNTITGAQHYCVLDIEFVDDPELYLRYRRIDPRPAVQRWPLRKVVAANVMTLFTDGSTLEVTGFKSFSGPDEDKLLLALFAHMKQHSGHRLCTYGGCATDVQILRAGAMAHGLKLPPQLVGNRRNRHGEFEHLDLAILMRGGGGTYVHMSEIAVRLNVPVKMGGSALAIPEAVRAGNFRVCEWLAEADTITTACLLAAHLASTGQILSAEAAQYSIIKFVRPSRRYAPYANYLGNVQDRLRRSMCNELQRWIGRIECAEETL